MFFPWKALAGAAWVQTAPAGAPTLSLSAREGRQSSFSFAVPSGTENFSHQIQTSLKSATSRLSGIA